MWLRQLQAQGLTACQEASQEGKEIGRRTPPGLSTTPDLAANIFEVYTTMPGTFDHEPSLANVHAIGGALAVYFFAQFEGETIHWARVRAHDWGQACHCSQCAPNCSMCWATRNPEVLAYAPHPVDPTVGW